MRDLVKTLMLGGFLVSCTTADNTHYRDISTLERPPVVAADRPSVEQRVTDDSAIPKKTGVKGLGEKVYLTTTTPVQLKIKQSFDQAWHSVNQALMLSDIKISDHERSKGHIYVNYGSRGLLEKALAFLSNGRKETNYLLLIEENGAETAITAAMSNANEQGRSSGDQDGYYDAPVDASTELLEMLYKILRDDFVGK
ncbi:MAG: outer membrane protein assembly factor BamC [Methylobacter sp.]|nr:outer membrane protein assembly factor BamC [Methylobacter sp.]MDP2099729.1 outer membrane protein assembly factor BamC [Methylobacter sp.]MDP2430363.1 outer membrane protein assembly factor BamC [Methylobacter sp.]MDP3053531.1 outer membrane protein assembly factor BamC [Methylobacter sp.]MDP3362710.1 outer membrane protein assembly factor BamC [Methylobacter sp.]